MNNGDRVAIPKYGWFGTVVRVGECMETGFVWVGLDHIDCICRYDESDVELYPWLTIFEMFMEARQKCA